MAINAAQEVAISLPFKIDSYGNVATTTSQSKIWSDRVKSVLGTSSGERVYRNLFGTEIPRTMFDTRTTMEESIKREVAHAFEDFLELLTLSDIDVSFDESQNVISADVTYSIPNNETVTTSISVLTLSGNQLPYEENA